MPRFTCKSALSILSVLMLVAGCSIDKLVEVEQLGALYVRAIDAYDSSPVDGQIYLNGEPAGFYPPDGAQWNLIDELPLDSSYVLRFLPFDTDNYFEPGEQPFLFYEQDVDSLTIEVLPRLDSLFTMTVISMLAGGDTLDGLPLLLNGEALPTLTPALVQFTPLVENELAVGNAECVRGDTTFSFAEDPQQAAMLIEVDDAQLSIDLGDAEAELILDEEATGLLDAAALINLMGAHFVSAYLPAHVVSSEAAFLFDSICDTDLSFAWEPGELSYQAGGLFEDFTLPEAGAQELSLRQFRGRVVLVNFWFTTCAPCLEEIPMLQEVLDEYHGEGFRILALDPLQADITGDPSVLDEWIAQNPGYDFRFLEDSVDPPVAQLAGVSVFPTNFILDRRGVIHSVHGQLEQETLVSIVEELLAE